MDNECLQGVGLQGARAGAAIVSKVKRGLCGLSHHRRSSSLVSDATIEAAIAGEDEKPFKCPRVLVHGCSSPGSTVATGVKAAAETHICAQPTTPSSKCAIARQQCQEQQSLLADDMQVQAIADPSQPMCSGLAVDKAVNALPQQQECTLQEMGMSILQTQQHVSVLPDCQDTCGMTQVAAAAAVLTSAGVCPLGPNTFLGSPVAPQFPMIHLNSLSLVASKLAGSKSPAADCAAGSSSQLLPATQATLVATTASVVAAEALAAAAAAASAGQQGSLLASTDVHTSSAAVAQPSAVAVAEEQQTAEHGPAPVCKAAAEQKQTDAQTTTAAKAGIELPSWLCSNSVGLEASAAVCRASLLSTTAALARLSQPVLRPTTATGQGKQPGLGSTVATRAVPAHGVHASAVPASITWAAPLAVQVPPTVVASPESMALGVPLGSGGVVGKQTAVGVLPFASVGKWASPGGWDHRLFDFSDAGAGELRCSILSAGGMQCNDASSCSSTPRAQPAVNTGAAKADATVNAAAELLPRSKPRRRCCWELADEEEEEQWGIAGGDLVEVASPPTPTVPSAVGAAAAVQQGGEAAEQTDAAQLAQDRNALDTAAECDVVVVVDFALKHTDDGFGPTGSVGVRDLY